MAKKKAEEKQKKPPKGQVNTLPDGSILDFSTLGIDDLKLTNKEMRFVFWYTYPGSEAFQIQTRAAVMAGYSQKTAYVNACLLRKKENIAAAIKRVMDNKVKIDLEEEYHRVLELKKLRIHYDIGDYVEQRQKVVPIDKEGNTIVITIEDFKDLKDLTPEQRMAIDGIDYRGMQAIKVYNFADRDRAMNDLVTLYQKINGPIDENAFDFEATAEIIKGHLAVKVTTRKKKDDLGESADFMATKGSLTEEL
ncbi:hypothetical protein FACS189447_03190 [Spirochaetia bacterium]|nr:hypothetical protein FACS189447_03190 [Spirochaetia bacterium]